MMLLYSFMVAFYTCVETERENDDDATPHHAAGRSTDVENDLYGGFVCKHNEQRLS